MRIRSAAVFILLFAVTVFARPAVSDSLYSQVDNLLGEFKYNDALKILLDSEKQDSTDFKILERLSRTYVLIGDAIPENTDDREDKQEEDYTVALNYANRAVNNAPGESVCYLRRAIANGKIALFKGVFSVAGVVDEVRADCEKAIELNKGSREVIATAHYVLGRTHAKVSEKWKPARSVLGLGWADIDSALAHYDSAVRIRDDFMMYYVDYAKALIREDEYDKACEILNKALKCKIKDKEDIERIKESKELLEEIKDE